MPFRAGALNTFFCELHETKERGFKRVCAACSAPLDAKGYHQRGPNQTTTFWMVRCT